MEFMNRGAGQPAAPARAAATGGAMPSSSGGTKKGNQWRQTPTWLRLVCVVLLFSATVLVIALTALMYFGGSKESDAIDKDRHQAVFLTNGQVYFGDLASVNGKYLDLRNIYYLNVNQQVQPDQKNANQQTQNSISLVKLGCELHGPLDQMIINREQVTFWENLKDDGQVSKAIAEWIKQNPDGQKCQTTTNTTTNTDATKP